MKPHGAWGQYGAEVPALDVPPHPQAIFYGFGPDDPEYVAMSRLVATSRLLDGRGYSALREVEWDVLVAREVEVDAPEHMHVLAMGCGRLGLGRLRSGRGSVTYNGLQPSQTLHVPDDLPDTLRRLVMADLVPWLRQQERRPFLEQYQGQWSYALQEVAPSGSWTPFVQDPDGNVIAGAFTRSSSDDAGYCWALPFMPAQPEMWLAAALEDWHERTPDRVPRLPGWRTRPIWSTGEEIIVRQDLAALVEERREVELRLNAREMALHAAAAAASVAAEQGSRRLLTSQGDALVAAVSEALTSLGFLVENVDDSLSDRVGAPKVEDLRVTEPDDPAWTNITEVRGYKGGAKASDLQRLARFAGLRAVEVGATPTSRWYIVNQALETDPDLRRPPLAGSEDDLEVFAEDGGLVLETRDLFLLLRKVEEGAIDASTARQWLRDRRGAFVMPE